MSAGPPTALTLAAAVGCGLNGGVFLAFSSFVMPALGRLRPAGGVAAMQAINREAVTVVFMAVLFGTAALCAPVAAWALLDPGAPRAGLQLAGAAVYLVGTIGLTVVFHVPRNEALAPLEPESAEAAREWRRYRREWTAGNHVRAVAATAAAPLLALAPA